MTRIGEGAEFFCESFHIEVIDDKIYCMPPPKSKSSVDEPLTESDTCTYYKYLNPSKPSDGTEFTTQAKCGFNKDANAYCD